jgi:hypothetical protein
MANRQNQERFCPKGRHVVVPQKGESGVVLSASMLSKCRCFCHIAT